MGLSRVILMVLLCTSISLLDAKKFPDWLVTKIKTSPSLQKTQENSIMLHNGLIAREFITSPDFATIDYYSYEKHSSLLRALGPEAQVMLDGVQYNIGGVLTPIPRAYLNRTDLQEKGVTVNLNAFHYSTHSTGTPVMPYAYRPLRGAPKDIKWPPEGVHLTVEFHAPTTAPALHQQVKVLVHYEMYTGLPLLNKWVSVVPMSAAATKISVTVNCVEYLAVNQQWGQQGGYGWLYVEPNEPHAKQVQWLTDPAAGKMPGSFQPLLNVSYEKVFSVPLNKGFNSFQVRELVIGSTDPERVGLAKHRMLRTLAPQTQENPIFFHMVDSDSVHVRSIIDQMAEVGFEMMIYSFGSGFKLESQDPAYIASIAADIKYAKSKGIEVGGYDLIVLDRGGLAYKYERIDPSSGKPGGDACIASAWYDYITNATFTFINQTGMSMFETDGPYYGAPCGATNHTHHKEAMDSVYWQMQHMGQYFLNLRHREIYINQPDYYFYQGANKAFMGYDENQYSLPRWQDLSVSRQGMFDDTFRLIPSSGWMFVPLVDYHGGGKAAAFEPLTQNIKEYEWALAQYLGAGVAACYRGYRLFDGAETKALVQKWVNFYKKYRDILNADLIHVRRPDMQSIDSYMHVNPHIQNKGLVMVFNPTQMPIKTTLELPLYYTGLTTTARVSQQGGTPTTMTLERDYSIQVTMDLQPLGITWFLIQ